MQKSSRLRVNCLESRLTPAVTVSYLSGHLNVTGDQTANAIVVTATANNQLQVKANAVSFGTFAVTGNLAVNTGNSADTVTVDLGAFTQTGNISANLNNGADQFNLLLAGGGMNGSLTVRGGLGDDSLNINAGAGAAGTLSGYVTVDGSTGNDQVSLGNDNGVTAFQGLVQVTAANQVFWSSTQNDLYAGDVLFSPGGDTLPLVLAEGAVGGSNLVTVAGNVRILGGAGSDTVFLRGMNVGGQMLASLGAGGNTFAVSSSASTSTVVNGSLNYAGGSGAENVDLSSGQFFGNVTLSTYDGDDSINLNTFVGPTIIGGNLTISAGNGNVAYTGGGIAAQINGNVFINQGNGNSTIPFAAGGLVAGRITVRTGGGSTLLQFLGAQSYNVYAFLGAGDDTVEINNAAGSIYGVLDGGSGVNQFLQTAGTVLAPFSLFNF